MACCLSRCQVFGYHAGRLSEWKFFVSIPKMFFLTYKTPLTCLLQCWHAFAGSWNGNTSQTLQQPIPTANSVEDQFTDPAIVSGCLSATDASGSPPGMQPHWLRSIQQLTEIDSSPIKQPTSTQPVHPMPNNVPAMYSRQPATHSRMPFAQNLHLSQPGEANNPKVLCVGVSTWNLTIHIAENFLWLHQSYCVDDNVLSINHLCCS